MTSPAARSPAAELLHLLGRSGPARLRVWPVTDHDRLSRLIAVLTRIDGVGAIAVERFDGHDALLLAQVEHAASADEILTARLARGMLACGVRDGRIEVQLVARSTGAPPPPGAATPGRFDVPPGLRSLRITPPLRGPVPPRGDVPRRPAPGDGRGPVGAAPRAAGQGTGGRGTRAGAADGASRPPGGASGRPAPGTGGPQASRLVELALRSILGRSLLVCDTGLRVLTVAGIAWPQPDDGRRGSEVRDVLEPGTWRALAPALATALGGGSEVVEFDGPGDVRFEATCTPVIDDGVVVGATAVARDLAVERGERAALGVLRDEFDAVFEQSTVGQGLLSIDGRWVRVNAELCELLGEETGALVGAEAADWLHPDDRARHLEHYAALLTGLEGAETATLRVVGARGHLSTARAHVAVLRTPDGWPRGAIVQLVRVVGP